MATQEANMQRDRITPDRIRRLQCPAEVKQFFLWDTEAPRLAVRATAGSKSFIFESKLNRQTIRITIGDVRAWDIDAARTEARRLQTLVDRGIDPRELARTQAEEKAAAILAKEKAKKEAENRKRFTLRALCKAYTDHLETKGKKASAAAARSVFKCHVLEANPEIADLPASEITALQIASVVRKVNDGGKKRTAGILRSYLSAAFNAAKKAPFDAVLPADFIPFGIEYNPVDNIPAIAVTPGERALSADELRAYMSKMGTDLADKALRLALLCGGQRMAQLLRAKVNDYNEEAQSLRLWDGKGKRATPREHLIPLPPKAAALVAELAERAKKKDSPWLFSSYGKVAMTATTPGHRVTEISTAMKGEPFDLRDIRRTCETMLAGMGISKDVRAQLLSHGLSGVQTTNYDKHDYFDEKRNALIAWENRLAEIATGKKTTKNVLQLTQPASRLRHR